MEPTSMECKRIHNLAHRDARKSRLLLFLFSGEKVPANIAAILIQDIPLLKSPEDSRLVIIKTIKEMQGFIESLSFKNQVAVGGFAKVWRAQASKEDGVNYAIKSIPKSREQLQDVAREVKAGELLKAKNIVNFICSFEKDDQYHLVFDFVKGVELFGFLEQRDFQPVDESQAKTIFRQLVDAVQLCHQNGIVHCDLKLDNVMYDPETNQVTLIDFGLCDFITEENKGLFTKRVGCMEYVAPELLTEEETPYEAIKMDIWCLGCILFALLNATFPFDFEQRKTALQNGQPHPHPTFPVDISSEARDLLNKLLTADPTKRISLEQVKEHAWLN